MYYIFKGLNATCGAPHSTTGLLNTYGDLIAFTSKDKRDHFFDEYYDHNNPSTVMIKCGKSTYRQFFLGMSVYQMQVYVNGHVNAAADETYNNWMMSLN
tara:strand:- start:5 stop:301 length:297 start_codon:yes stop_codon:yes gene_type:complete